MATPLDTPIFFEALADAAHCTIPDAVEHFEQTAAANELGRLHPVERFLNDYAA